MPTRLISFSLRPCSGFLCFSFSEKQQAFRGLTIVSLEWLTDCVKKGEIIRDTTNYEIQKMRFRSLEPVIGTCRAYRLDRQQLVGSISFARRLFFSETPASTRLYNLSGLITLHILRYGISFVPESKVFRQELLYKRCAETGRG